MSKLEVPIGTYQPIEDAIRSPKEGSTLMIRSIASAIIEDNAAMLALLGMTFPIYSVSNKLLWDASRSLAEKWFDIGSNGNLKRSGISVSAMSILVQAASTVNRLVPTFPGER